MTRHAAPTFASIMRTYGLTKDVVDRLRNLCAEFKATPVDRRGSRAKSMQREAMRAIHHKARELRELLDDLPNGECMTLDRELRALSVPEAARSEPLFSAAVTVQRTLCNLAVAATRVADGVEASGTRGRRSTLGFSVSFVTFISIYVKDSGIAPNRTVAADGTPSPFLAICRACFAEAGIASDPDGAIQSFMRGSRHELKGRGFCL